MTNKKHEYDWDAMVFNPDEGDIWAAFAWSATPQRWDWWFDNQYTHEGRAEFARMKRLYAEDMAEKKGPVRTVTRKEIVPGVYGKVRVDNLGGIGVEVQELHDADELRAAAETLNQIADALDNA